MAARRARPTKPIVQGRPRGTLTLHHGGDLARTMVFGAINSQPAVKSNASGPAVLAGGRTGGSESFARCESQAWQKEGLGNI
jgi:hypothetical protein